MDQATIEPPVDSATSKPRVLNVPNQITVARLALSVACFVFLACDWYLTALVLFVIAAGTDWIDGYWARKYGQVTKLGRVLDPFADKIVICGAFIFLAAVPRRYGELLPASGIAAWMAVVVVARELLVTAIRGFFEEQGIDFSAKWAGKWKMLFQCVAAGVSMYRLTYFDPRLADWTTLPPDWMTILLHASVWTALAMTVYSGWEYCQNALRLVRK
ncbi:MAG TPA: CDP-diacylglycerol--glycerol-3-phosphate 3-phosphatidyltransferase [Lacipirellulaceae bacterium]|jgi:CDP-diacylglycerol--glycerol-3-phosphate 3-phosphatidyltransferase